MYAKWVEKMISLPKGYKTPNFTTFFGKDDKSTLKHID